MSLGDRTLFIHAPNKLVHSFSTGMGWPWYPTLSSTWWPNFQLFHGLPPSELSPQPKGQAQLLSCGPLTSWALGLNRDYSTPHIYIMKKTFYYSLHLQNYTKQTSSFLSHIWQWVVEFLPLSLKVLDWPMVVNEKVYLSYLASKRVKIAYLNIRAKSLASFKQVAHVGNCIKLLIWFLFLFFMGVDFLGVEWKFFFIMKKKILLNMEWKLFIEEVIYIPYPTKNKSEAL